MENKNSFVVCLDSGVPRLFYAQARIRKFAAKAACGPRGEQGKKKHSPTRF